MPTATDIAFVVRVLSLLARRIPVSLRVLLLAVGIIEDIVAILVIALFYAQGSASVASARGPCNAAFAALQKNTPTLWWFPW